MTLTDERRLVTVLFADLVGFTSRAEESDPEAVRDIQRRYFEATSRAIERYGGAVEKFIGDAVVAIFGAPIAHDDDAERALRAALHIREAVGELDPDLQVRIGVNTGEVVGGQGSGPQAADYTVSGDAVNVAARLQQTAAPGEIWVGHETRRLSAEAFAFAPLAELALKGRSDTVEAWRLERELPERPRLRGGEAPLVGRDRELAALQSALDEAASGRGMVMALVGEAGLGKSRMALELRQRADAGGFRSVWTTSRSYSAAFPYHLLGQLVRQLLDRRSGPGPADVPESLEEAGVEADRPTLVRWAAVLRDVIGESEADVQQPDLTPAGRQRNLVQAIAAVVRATAARQPLLMVLDDMHWVDPASQEVVEELLDFVPDQRVLVLALYRPGWSHGWEAKSSYQQINLRALLNDDARRLAGELDPQTRLAPALVERVLQRSAGNPFFLEQLLHAESHASGEAGHRLPATLHEILLARLDALPSQARQALQFASVVGMEFSETIVAWLISDEENRSDLDEALRTLQRSELIVGRSADADARTLAFRHPLIHEVAYRSLLVSTRRILHGRVARWLQEHGGDELVAELALHSRDGDDPEMARTYLPLAGQRAESLNANSEARGWYLDAAQAFVNEPSKRAEMLEAAARQAYLVGGIAGDVPEAIDLLSKAIPLYEAAGQEVAALNARRWLGRYYWLRGDPTTSDREIGLAIAGLERLAPTSELAFAYSFRSQSFMLQPDYAAGEEWARKAISVAEATSATGALVHAYNNLGVCLGARGDPQGIEYLKRSLALALEHGLTDDAGRAYSNLSGQGDRIFPFGYAGAEAFLDEARAFGQRTIPGGIFDRWIRSGHAEFLVVSGRWAEAERAMNEVDWPRAEAYIRTSIDVLRSHLASYRGRYDDGAALLGDDPATTTEEVMRIGDLQAVLPAMAALAQSQVGLGDVTEAIATLSRAVDAVSEKAVAWRGTPWFVFEATDLLTAAMLRDGGLARGIELIGGMMHRVASHIPIGLDQSVVAVKRALFGAAAEQIGVLASSLGLSPPSLTTDLAGGRTAALAALEDHHRLFDAARVRLWLAEERGERELLGDARDVFDELGAHPYLARAASL